MPKKEPPFIRFLKSVCERPDTGCWLWEGHKYKNGYGCIKAFGKTVSAHRFSYELYNGPIPPDMEILHSCDIKRCVNPDHLRVGTHAENMKEAATRGLMRSGLSHPRYGKPNPSQGQAMPVLVLGTMYESMKSAERALGLGSGTVRYWVKTNPKKAKKIRKEK